MMSQCIHFLYDVTGVTSRPSGLGGPLSFPLLLLLFFRVTEAVGQSGRLLVATGASAETEFSIRPLWGSHCDGYLTWGAEKGGQSEINTSCLNPGLRNILKEDRVKISQSGIMETPCPTDLVFVDFGRSVHRRKWQSFSAPYHRKTENDSWLRWNRWL